MNMNKMPTNVTPAYYLERRGRIAANHDVKGFYVTACAHFGLARSDEMMKRLDGRNRLTRWCCWLEAHGSWL